MAWLSTVTAADSPALDVKQVRDALRIDTADEDKFLLRLIDGVVAYWQGATGKQLINETFDYTLDEFPEMIELPRLPCSSVTSITYNDSTGSSQTLSASSYTTSLGSSRKKCRIIPAYGESWPTTYGHIDDVTVRFVAGFGADSTAVPESIRRELEMYVGDLWWNREASREKKMEMIPAVINLSWANRNVEFV